MHKMCNALKGTSTLKGINTLKSTSTLKGINTLKSMNTLKSASTLKSARNRLFEKKMQSLGARNDIYDKTFEEI